MPTRYQSPQIQFACRALAGVLWQDCIFTGDEKIVPASLWSPVAKRRERVCLAVIVREQWLSVCACVWTVFVPWAIAVLFVGHCYPSTEQLFLCWCKSINDSICLQWMFYFVKYMSSMLTCVWDLLSISKPKCITHVISVSVIHVICYYCHTFLFPYLKTYFKVDSSYSRSFRSWSPYIFFSFGKMLFTSYSLAY